MVLEVKIKTQENIRIDQNWIGKPGITLEDTTFVPVALEHLNLDLENLEEYICNYDEQSALVQVAIIHVQFKKMHPFKDRNGRIGRMLIPLFLYHKNVISRPVLYVSEFFEENRKEYYYKLNSIDEEQGWINWILFFLKVVETQSNKNIEKIKKLQKSYNDCKILIKGVLNSKTVFILLMPFFNIQYVKFQLY